MVGLTLREKGQLLPKNKIYDSIDPGPGDAPNLNECQEPQERQSSGFSREQAVGFSTVNLTGFTADLVLR